MTALKKGLQQVSLWTAAAVLGLCIAPLASAENRTFVPGQDVTVVKLLSSADHYAVVLGLGRLESSTRNLGYLAYEQQGTLQSLGLGSGSTTAYSVRRLSFKAEAFDDPQQPLDRWLQGMKFDLFLADTQIGSNYAWQGVGIGAGLLVSPLGKDTPLHLTVGADVEPSFTQLSGTSTDQYQLNTYQEAEYFLTEALGVTVRHSSLSTGNGLSLNEKVSELWFGLRFMF